MVELELRREALERTQELCRFQQQFDEAPVLLSVVSPSERKFEYANKAFRSLLPDCDLLGRSLHDVFRQG